MICLDNTDTLEGGASVDAVVDYTVHGLVGTTFTNIVAGVMNTTLTAVLYTAAAAISVVSIILVNTHSSAVAVTLRLDPANGGNPRYIIPKTVSLGAGYSLHTDGARITVMDASGNIITSVANVVTAAANITANTVVVGDDGVRGVKYATAAVTIPTINLTSGQIVFPAAQNASAGVNTLDDYEEGVWTPDLQFGSAKVGITYSTQAGLYTKVGRLVCVTAYMLLTSKGTSVGNAEIYGLPFTINNNAGAYSVASLRFTSITFANVFQGIGMTNTTKILIEEITEAGIRTNLTNSNFANNSSLILSITYTVG